MRKITVLSMVTLDGVIQGPGGTKEDTSNGFEYSGWVAPYSSEDSGELFEKMMQPADLLLGRKTFDIWENYWPTHEHMWPGVNDVTKYVLSSTRDNTSWANCKFISDEAGLKKLKQSEGGEIKVWGSSEVIQLLMKHDMVDEFWLMIYPITLGQGKKLFSNGPIPAAFTLGETKITSTGVIMANYKRAGEVKTGNVGE